MNIHRLLPVMLGCTLLTVGCAGDMSDLEEELNKMKQRPAARIEPLPQVKPYEIFVYEASNLRSPFVPDTETRQQTQTAVTGGMSPDFARNREYLEEFPLDTLRMVGTLELRGDMYGLIRTTDGAVHRVKVGDYLGQNHGRITAVSESRIDLTEIIPDGSGGWTERRTGIALSE